MGCAAVVKQRAADTSRHVVFTGTRGVKIPRRVVGITSRKAKAGGDLNTFWIVNVVNDGRVDRRDVRYSFLDRDHDIISLALTQLLLKQQIEIFSRLEALLVAVGLALVHIGHCDVLHLLNIVCVDVCGSVDMCARELLQKLGAIAAILVGHVVRLRLS
jgi:hypothetical protein